MDLTKVYYDQDGLSGNILQVVRREPEWAANRIQVGERALAMLSEDQRRAAESAESAPSASTNTGSPKLLLDELLSFEFSVRGYKKRGRFRQIVQQLRASA